MTRACLSGVLLLILGGAATSAQMLTAEDYVEIRNIAQAYNLGYDSSARADAGAVVERVFTPQMSFTRDGSPNWFSAREMAEYSAKATSGTHHWDSNIVIAPSPGGATLFRYTLVYRVGDTGSPVTISTAGTLQESWVKTPDGWFLKDRYNRSAGLKLPYLFPTFDGRPIAPVVKHSAGKAGQVPKARKGKPALAAIDYVEIENLYGWNNLGLDSAAEQGEMFARTFTPDGSMQVDGRTLTGRKELAAFAATGEPALRRWLSNLYIEPTADGAVGWAYVLTIDGFTPTGTPSKATIGTGVLYRDVLVRTADGWRFKSRTASPGNGVPEGLPLPRVR
ncbi:MAG: nuclear transport factor 2 family protein [Vicinamibacterales bacterium]